MYKIIIFEGFYRDDAIFCLLSAKDALDRVARLGSDILNI